MNLGLAIEECRKLKGVTKSKLAEDSELSLPYLSQIIGGRREPTLSTIEKISRSLGIPSSLLVFLASEESELSSLSKETTSELKAITKQLIEASSDTTIVSQIFG